MLFSLVLLLLLYVCSCMFLGWSIGWPVVVGVIVVGGGGDVVAVVVIVLVVFRVCCCCRISYWFCLFCQFLLRPFFYIERLLFLLCRFLVL